MTKQKPGIKIGGHLPQVTQINKKLVMGGGIVLVGLVVVIVIVAFSPRAVDHHQADISPSTYQQLAVQPNTSLIEKLPSTYADQKAMARFTGHKAAPENQALKKQLSDLKNEQVRLKNKLDAMSRKSVPTLPVQAPMDYETKQAIESALFFSGGAPVPLKRKSPSVLAPQKTSKSSPGVKASSVKGPYAEQNNQKGKLDFLNNKVDTSIYNKSSLQIPPSRFMLQAGTVIPAILQSTLVSNLPGTIVARVERNVYDSVNGRYLLVPKGSLLMGQYNSSASYAQYQLQAKFTRIIRPDGTSITLPNSQGITGMGTSGLSDEVDNHWGRVISSAALMAVFNIPAVVATNQMQSQAYDDGNGNLRPYSVGQLGASSALQSAGQSISQVGSNIANKSLNIQPTITINSGYQFSILVNKDIVLTPYHST